MAVQFTAEHKRTSEYRFYPEDIKIKPELNGRHEKPDIEWLINDILLRGQTTPVIIRNDGGKAVLVAGFSRWRAISEINKRKLTPLKMQLRCTYVQCSESEAFLINISENRFRNPTSPVDDAHNIKRLLNIYNLTEDGIAKVYFPTAETVEEMKVAIKFVRQRVTLISLTPEAEEAIRAGRVKENAATAIAKLSEAQQREYLQAHPEGQIERKHIKPAKPAKAPTLDVELRRRINVMLEDVEGLLSLDEKYIEVETKLVKDISDYIKAK